MDNQRHDEPCDSALTLQKLLDGELDPAAAEVVLHHVEWCERCQPVLARLRAQRDRSTEILGMEDQADLEWSADALRRVKSALTVSAPSVRTSRVPWVSRWRLAGVAVMSLLLVIAAPSFVPTDAGASSERIARESILRERAWMSRPNTVRHWAIDSDIRNRPGVRDGRYRREVWQQNGDDGRWARVTRQYDSDRRLVSASWIQADGSSTVWSSTRQDEIVTRPSTAALAAAQADLPADLQRALAAHLSARHQSSTLQLQQQNFADYLRRASAVGNRTSTFDRIRSTSGQDFYCVRSEVIFPDEYRPVTRLTHEDYIGADDFRRYRMRTWRHFVNGVVETEDARTTYVEHAQPEDFRRQTLEDLISRSARVIALTPRDIAAEQLAREKYPPPTPVVEKGALKPGDKARLTVRWIVEDGYYLDEKTTSTIVFTPPAGIAIAPGKLETSGRIVGVSEQTASVDVAKTATPGVYRVKMDTVIFFCSVREQWCRRVTRTTLFPVEVSNGAGDGPKSIEIELRVPLDDER